MDDGQPTSDRSTTIGCPIFATDLSSLSWAIFTAVKIPDAWFEGRPGAGQERGAAVVQSEVDKGGNVGNR
jgi:hypothetical protein